MFSLISATYIIPVMIETRQVLKRDQRWILARFKVM